MRGQALDRDRVLAGLQRSVLAAGERIVDVLQRGPDRMWVDTDRRGFSVEREVHWRLAAEPWVDDVVSVEGSVQITHTDPELYGLVYDQEGQEYFLGFGGDGLAELGRRLTLEPGQGGLSPAAFAEVLALFRSAAFNYGELIDDFEALEKRFPELANVPGVHPVSRRRGEDGGVELEFYSVVGYGGAGRSGYHSLVILEWTVLVVPGRPATWEKREFFVKTF